MRQRNGREISKHGRQDDTQDGVAKRRARIFQGVIRGRIKPPERGREQTHRRSCQNPPDVHCVRVRKAARLINRGGNDVTQHQKRRNLSRSEEHTSELQSRLHLVCRLLLEKKKQKIFILFFLKKKKKKK